MTSEPREKADGRLEKGKATRERLVAAARELFSERGYDGTSIDAVLESAGVARGALYHHFDTKEALFDAAFDRVVADIAATTADAARGAGDDPVATLRAGCGAWLRMAADPKVQRIALLDPPSVVGWIRARELDEKYTLGGLKLNLQRIRDSGRLPAGDVDVLAHMLLAAVNEAALMIAQADDSDAALASGLAAVDALIDGLVSGG
jgi:AcrR family transcriptional regulator